MSDSTSSRATDVSARRIGLPARFLVAVTIVAAACTGVSAEAAAAPPSTTSAQVHTVADPILSEMGLRPAAGPYAPVASEAAFAAMFKQIMRIPDEVLREGDVATNAWIDQNLRRPDPKALTSERDVTGCIAAVVTMLAGFVPAGRIVRIKALIEKLGGVIDAASAIVGKLQKGERRAGGAGAHPKGKPGSSSDKERQKPSFNDAVTALVLELSGFASVRDNCFR